MLWNTHVDPVQAKLSQLVGLIFRNRSVLTGSIVKIIYNTFFYLGYIIAIWYGEQRHKSTSRSYTYYKNIFTSQLHPHFSFVPQVKYLATQ